MRLDRLLPLSEPVRQPGRKEERPPGGQHREGAEPPPPHPAADGAEPRPSDAPPDHIDIVV